MENRRHSTRNCEVRDDGSQWFPGLLRTALRSSGTSRWPERREVSNVEDATAVATNRPKVTAQPLPTCQCTFLRSRRALSED